MFGSAYHPVGMLVQACEDVVGPSRVQLLCLDDSPAHRRAYVVVGVRALKRHAHTLQRHRTTIVVADSMPDLIRVKGLRVLDADRYADPAAWEPRPLRRGPLTRALLRDPKRPTISVAEDQVAANLISDLRSRGVLGHVLTFAQRAPDSGSRDALHACVARFLSGELSLATVARRTAPKGGSARMEAHARMLAALASEQADRLREAIAMAVSGVDPADAAARKRVDAFEIRYVINLLRKRG
jgi:hypothetical protein